MFSRRIIILWICGIQTLIPVSSSGNSGIKYSHDSETNDKVETVLVPNIERVKRDVIAENIATTTQANKIYKDTSEDGLTDEFLKKEVFLNKTSAEDKVKTHNDYSFDNDTLQKYYSHSIEQGQDYFVDLDWHNSSGSNAGRVKEHNMLSQSYRRAATINLSFKFPFYGHPVENITIATGGFLYTGDYVHSWLAATQYIAPLMANFDTSRAHDAKIRYLDDGNKLIVEWKDVFLQDKSTKGRDGPFTFQVILFQNGNITFAYQTIPIDIKIITDEDHPVKVGLSDAYIIDRTVYFARRKTIYEYHRMSMKEEMITNKTAIIFKPLPTCNTNPDCNSCLLSYDYDYDEHDYYGLEPGTGQKLECRWCQALGRCSDGTDRNRQEWLKNKCDTYNVSSVQYCSASTPGQTYGYPGEHHTDYYDSSHQQISHDSAGGQEEEQQMHAGSIVISVFILVLVVTLCGWLGYAYFNPNTDSGRFLIKYRPGAWRWRQSGARYTAASIHM